MSRLVKTESCLFFYLSFPGTLVTSLRVCNGRENVTMRGVNFDTTKRREFVDCGRSRNPKSGYYNRVR